MTTPADKIPSAPGAEPSTYQGGHRRPTRVGRAAAMLCSAAFVLAGCSGGDDQARTVPEPSVTAESSTSSPDEAPAASPTKTEAATSSTPSEAVPSPSPTEATSGSAEPEGDAAELEAIVLTLDDMPSGWTTDPEIASDDDDSAGGLGLCGVEDADLDVDDTDGESVDAGFKQSDFGPFVLNSVASLPSSEQAAEALDSFLDAASQCSEWTETDEEGVETTYSISPLSFDNVGDDTIAFRISADAEGFPLTIDMVTWHDGPLASIVALVGLGGTEPEILTDLVETVASRM